MARRAAAGVDLGGEIRGISMSAGTYIAVTLQALESAPLMARAARISEDTAIAGLNRLWAYCWREKTNAITPTHVAGLFTPDADQLVPSLIAFGFLEQDGLTLRVRGAEKYLRIAEGRSKGGKKAAGNLKQGTTKPGNTSRLTPGSTPAESRLSPGLSSSIEHRASNIEIETLAPAVASARDEKPDFRAAQEALCTDYATATGAKYAWNGAKDSMALKWCLSQAPLEEVRARWLAGLQVPHGKFERTSTLAELRAKWNNLTPLVSATKTPETARHAAIDWLSEIFPAAAVASLQSLAKRVEWDSGPPVRVVTDDKFFAGWIGETFGGHVVAEVVT